MTTKVNQQATNSKDELSLQKDIDSSVDTKDETKQVNQQKRLTLTPEQMQVLVMRQLNQVNSKKDELTFAIKQLGDLATQLSNICAQQNKVLSQMKSEEK